MKDALEALGLTPSYLFALHYKADSMQPGLMRSLLTGEKYDAHNTFLSLLEKEKGKNIRDKYEEILRSKT